MPRLSNGQYAQLCTAAWQDLKPGERRGALRWKAAQTDDPALSKRVEHLLADNPRLSVDQAYETARIPDEPGTQPAGRDDAWLDVPPENLHRSHKPSKYKPIALLLRDRPGKWRDLGLVMPSWRQAGALAASIRHGDGAFKPKGSYDARAVENPRGVFRVYASYKGGES